MPARAENINTFDLKLLKALLNFKFNKNYARDLTTQDKVQLCKTYGEDGILTITHNYLIKIWPRGKEISNKVTVATLDQLCGALKKNYRWFVFINDISKFRPTGIPDDKEYLLLNNNQKEQINEAITEIFFRYKKFEEFVMEVIDKIDSVDKEQKNKIENFSSTSKREQEKQQIAAFASKIYFELTTRKAALPIDEENDVIEEVYNSWYKLFCIIRDEIKLLPVSFLSKQNGEAVITLTKKILNEVLRPHLTEHQAKFRSWLRIAKEQPRYKNITPQELQKKYPGYKILIQSMKEVNKKLITFSNEFYSFMN